jgi:NAD(P)-dependent dehydrogenase (short-subunit alcohol dehydrogenase family)
MPALEGKAAIVNGGGTGIGRAIALAFAREGAKVAVFGRRVETLREVVDAIAAAGGTARAMAGDVGRELDVGRLVDETCSQWGGVDVLVNSAAVRLNAPLGNISADDFAEVLRINLVGAFVLTRMVIGPMRARVAGRSSTSAPRSARPPRRSSPPTSPPRVGSTHWPAPPRSSWCGMASA